MSEYIDREKFLERLSKEYPGVPPHGAIVVQMLCDEAPADVRPVEVGLWLRIGNTGLASCRCGFISDRYSTYRYCPSCGRKNGGVEYGG